MREGNVRSQGKRARMWGWVALLGLWACGPSEVPSPADGDGPPTAAPEEVAPPSPEIGDSPGVGEMVAETISIEGIPEAIAVQSVQPPPGFPLPFTTVAPRDMRVDFVASGEGDAVRFEAEFGGVHNPEAFLALTVLPAGTTADQARDRVAELAGDNPSRPEALEQLGWVVESYMLRGDRSGFVALGQKDSRWFYFLASYPPEFGDGIGPRIDLILSRWRWSDGSALSDGRPSG